MSGRATTRSQSESNPNLLAPPLDSFRRRRLPTRVERLRSPNNFEEEVGLRFTFEMATPEQIAAIRDELRNEIRAEFRNEAAAAAAQIPDAIRRKPDIPSFDKQHVEIWLKRTNNAFIRAGITSPTEKFAFLETKFPVGTDAKIDEFLYSDGTANDWDGFVAYLKSEYGPSKQQRASILIDGPKRDGRKPSQFAAFLDDKTKDVTVDDIKKEILLREMPPDVRRMLQERIEGLSFKDAAKIADSYFDSEGRPKHSNPASTSVNEVTEQFSSAFTEPFSESDDTVNAVGRRFPQRQQNPRGNAPRQPNPNWQKPSQAPRNDAPPAVRQRKPNPENPQKNGYLCNAHFKWGDNARYCKVGCPRFDEKRFPGNATAGRK